MTPKSSYKYSLNVAIACPNKKKRGSCFCIAIFHPPGGKPAFWAKSRSIRRKLPFIDKTLTIEGGRAKRERKSFSFPSISFMALVPPEFMHEEEETDNGTPLRYVDLQHLYSSTSPCSVSSTTRSSNVTTKKVKARKLLESIDNGDDETNDSPKNPKKPPLRVYQRRYKRPCHSSFLDVGEKSVEVIDPTPDRVFDSDNAGRNIKSRKRASKFELMNLGVHSCDLVGSSGHRLRQSLRCSKIGSGRKCDSGEKKRRKPESQNCVKRWVE